MTDWQAVSIAIAVGFFILAAARPLIIPFVRDLFRTRNINQNNVTYGTNGTERSYNSSSGESVGRQNVQGREEEMSDRIRSRFGRQPKGIGGGYGKIKIAIVVIGFIVGMVVVSQSIVIVEAGHRGVVLKLGAVQPVVLEEGFHTITPFTDHVIQMDVRTQRLEAPAPSATNDLQGVATTVTVNYKIDSGRANVIYQTLGENYADKIIAPAIQESVKASTAKFSAEELITKRENAKSLIDSTLRKTIEGRDIILEQVLITDFQFSKEFNDQVSAKTVAYQRYLTEQNNLLAAQVVANQTVVNAKAQAQADIATKEGEVRQAELAAQARIALAQGDAESIRLITEELKNNPDYLQLQAINRWNGIMPQFYGGGQGSNTIFSIPLGVQQQPN